MVQSAVVENDSDAFSVSLLAFWVKGSITLDDAFLRVNMPNTVFFGLVPAGKQKDSSPLSGITNVYTSKSYKLSSIFFRIINCNYWSSANGLVILFGTNRNYRWGAFNW
ncbi:hypothetical protein [Pediococcus acidilactici]|uniref:hypothetical protein n=1 Tax=Pediococcus acidilactici TaxID=1254 RepID=UPI001CCC5683|nr:hypothetical protein [Pediococcus acidilactici]